MAWKSDLRTYAESLTARGDRARTQVGRAGQAVARGRARKRTGEMRARLEYNARIDALEGGAPQTLFNEYGTRYMAAQPMLVPAFRVMTEQVADAYERAYR